ncbi:uncharacterized protein TM35_000092720 [Trypanosoma theileri]|uniref:UBA domain-containing protein n=1 Tax=Trypanosoma theileri TaxID=67003 RepID=A0A1X0NZX2_9TRYP|nr:uncharacterized protein TM35_000092720 [Trypanosoma theileri]ORC90222.1 hypothetical protein TM35_000092720 [Trypanosoma theileri]
MKLTVKCSLAGESGGTKELVIHNPKATLSNLRAAIAINFRLPVHSFRMIHSSVDFSSEQILLRDSGIQDGDLITVAAKRDREEEESEGQQQQQQQEGEKGEASGKHTAVEITKTSTTNDSSLSVVPASSGEVVREAEGSGVGQMMINNNDSDEEMEEEDEEDMMEDGAREMLSHLLATVPNLLEMRQQFLANPAEIMQQIREQDPRLFELITANHQEFLDLVNNEALVETLQREQEEEQNGLLDEEEGDFEYEDEAEDLINSLMAEYMGSVAAAALADGDDENEPNEATDVAITETQRYLDRIPTEEEEAKIEQLMQLGFTKDQCKVAFFKAKRSLERAANLLFEDPPQL